MCQPPRQLSPLVRSAVKYAETTKPFARVKLVVITRIDILYIPANLSDSVFLSLERILFKSSLVNERMLAIERKCTRFVCPSIELTVTPKPSLLTVPEPALSSLKVTVDRKKIVRLYSRRCQPWSSTVKYATQLINLEPAVIGIARISVIVAKQLNYFLIRLRSYNSARSLVRTATLAAGQGRTETAGTPLEYRRREVTEVS